jgi:hypothetical protein
MNSTGTVTQGSGSATNISNDVLKSPRTGSALKVDPVKPIYNNINGKPTIVKEFPNTPQAHGFNNIVDNYAGSAIQRELGRGATLSGLGGSLNGVPGRFEWIIQNGKVTYRMFVQGGTVSGGPIIP